MTQRRTALADVINTHRDLAAAPTTSMAPDTLTDGEHHGLFKVLAMIPDPRDPTRQPALTRPDRRRDHQQPDHDQGQPDYAIAVDLWITP
ncbi:hypothetical protein [Micromonospora sp. LH3U1]|uniref:hypothetical protein n=1 Tax=Micromonospora sp. LH3U1 TaxID=3018339 RepID=UPI0023496650|nr:hypothetical protein [Micromonospora sp. LH3U1]WCN83870.1 hypothetical protein PCA76_12895 [Micromonospora sp. LH3U1]